MSGELDPDARALLETIGEREDPSKLSIPIDQGRELLAEMVLDHAESRPVETKRDLRIAGPEGSLPIRIYKPSSNGPFPVFVFYHGGGWVRGDLETHDPMCTHVAAEADCMIISVDYRRPPEDKFPAALEDCYAATQWAAENAGALGGDINRIAVGGDSAGGNLAAAVSLLARERDGPDIDYQVLLYPAVNDIRIRSFDSYEEHDGYGDTIEGYRWAVEQYVRDDIDGYNPFAFPIQANDLSDLPPALVLTCEFDILRDEGHKYADRLEEDGTPVDRYHDETTFHPFLCFPQLEATQQAYAEIAERLTEVFERN